MLLPAPDPVPALSRPAPAPASAEAGVFAPPLDRTLIYRTETRFRFGTEHNSVHLVRRIVFHRAQNGYVAEMTLTDAGGTAHDKRSALFAAGVRPLTGSVIRYHLDAGGKILSVEDRAELWRRFCDGIVSRFDGVESPRKADAPAIRARMLALSPAQQRMMLGSLLSSAYDVAATARGVHPTEDVSRPTLSYERQKAALTGTRRSWMDGKLLTVETSVSGDLRTPDKTGHPVDAHLIITTQQEIDPATALIVRRTNTKTTAIDGLEQVETTVATVSEQP
ncbi:hypothetical protein GCM10023219_00210 [Stakelama sediminis]|uniref:Uncharacterized protein n=1 Tax=Stakelama sediminis TaxID=463200 RepID=A0A840Z1H7_9SPHN|nr:hypothetical protein [Stakelama sediminis]MBB5719542.1 hypothetical protein [Stakelama sediminis]